MSSLSSRHPHHPVKDDDISSAALDCLFECCSSPRSPFAHSIASFPVAEATIFPDHKGASKTWALLTDAGPSSCRASVRLSTPTSSSSAPRPPPWPFDRRDHCRERRHDPWPLNHYFSDRWGTLASNALLISTSRGWYALTRTTTTRERPDTRPTLATDRFCCLWSSIHTCSVLRQLKSPPSRPIRRCKLDLISPSYLTTPPPFPPLDLGTKSPLPPFPS